MRAQCSTTHYSLPALPLHGSRSLAAAALPCRATGWLLHNCLPATICTSLRCPPACLPCLTLLACLTACLLPTCNSAAAADCLHLQATYLSAASTRPDQTLPSLPPIHLTSPLTTHPASHPELSRVGCPHPIAFDPDSRALSLRETPRPLIPPLPRAFLPEALSPASPLLLGTAASHSMRSW